MFFFFFSERADKYQPTISSNGGIQPQFDYVYRVGCPYMFDFNSSLQNELVLLTLINWAIWSWRSFCALGALSCWLIRLTRPSRFWMSVVNWAICILQMGWFIDGQRKTLVISCQLNKGPYYDDIPWHKQYLLTLKLLPMNWTPRRTWAGPCSSFHTPGN
jgi:hypothetical protein